MSKIRIKAIIKNSREEFKYEGFAIKDGNVIEYYDSDILARLIIDDVSIERKKDYDIKMKFKEGKKIKGSYETYYGSFNLETFTKSVRRDEKGIKIIYDLIINDELIDTFTYICEYSIDS